MLRNSSPAAATSPLVLPFHSGAVSRALMLVVILASAVGLFVNHFSKARGGFVPRSLDRLLAAGREGTLPNALDGFLLLAATASFALCAALARRGGPLRWRFALAGVVFAAMLVDEWTLTHLSLAAPLARLAAGWGAGPAMQLGAWLVVVLGFAGLFGLLWLPGLRHLPRHTRWLCTAAAALYISGAAGLKLVGYALWPSAAESLLYQVVQMLEELLEMAGLVMLLYALWDYLAGNWPGIEFQLQGAAGQPPHTLGAIKLPPGRVVRALAIGLGLLSLAYLILHVITLPAHLDGVLPNRLLDMDQEMSLPTVYNGSLLSLAATLLVVISLDALHRRDRRAMPWLALAAAFVFLTLDELISIHEIFTGPMRTWFGLSGLLGFGWYLLAVPLAALLGLFCLDLVRRLPPRTRLLFIVAGAVYISGAAGMEMFGSLAIERLGQASLAYHIEVLLEETLEMTGLLVLIYALLDYLAAGWGALRLVFAPVRS